MKRSEINAILRAGSAFFKMNGFLLPPFSTFTQQQWESNHPNAKEILDLKLGWDITCFGGNDFYSTGLLLFTLRNGALHSDIYYKPYAEKIMMVHEQQVTPRHFHWNKCEDIINRGGGNLVIEVWKADKKNQLTEQSFSMSVNGIKKQFDPGHKFILPPGHSVCFEPRIAHCFYGEKGSGPVLVGEVSMVNDDSNDNCFIDNHQRFDTIEEDEDPLYYLTTDYEQFQHNYI